MVSQSSEPQTDMLPSSDLQATDLLALAIDSEEVDPRIYDFESKQAMKDEFEWTNDEVEIWQYLVHFRQNLVS